MTDKIKYTKTDVIQLGQIYREDVWDGDLVSKSSRDALYESGFIARTIDGYNVITDKGKSEFLFVVHTIIKNMSIQ